MTVHNWSAALTALPKVELFVHLEGMMRADTVRELARKNGVPLALNPFSPLFEYGDRREFHDVVALVQSVLRTRQDWALLAYESTLDAVLNGVVHREVSFSPARHLAAGVALADVIAGIDDGMTAGEKETGVVTRMICDIDRVFGPTAALEQVDLLVRLKRERAHGTERVIGIGMDGMDGTDVDDDPSVFVEVYEAARSAGLHRTAQVGSTSPRAIVVALDELRCERIDHGITVLDDPRLVARMVRDRIPLNVTPSEEVSVDPESWGSLAEHAFPRLRSAGLLVTLNSGEPALTGVSLGEEYRTVSRAFGLDWDSMVSLALAGVEAAWLGDEERSRLSERIRHAADSLRPAA